MAEETIDEQKQPTATPEEQDVQRQEVNPVFEIDDLVKDTYNSIASWHNDEPNSVALKQLCLDLVQKITAAALGHVGLTATLNVDTEGVRKNIKE